VFVGKVVGRRQVEMQCNVASVQESFFKVDVCRWMLLLVHHHILSAAHHPPGAGGRTPHMDVIAVDTYYVVLRCSGLIG